jgi:hypothetical protein
MRYHWPLPHPDPVLDEAADIALDYLEATGQAKTGDDTQYLVTSSVLTAWVGGARHRIRLANEGIVAVQQAHSARPPRKPGEVHLDALRDLAVPSGFM